MKAKIKWIQEVETTHPQITQFREWMLIKNSAYAVQKAQSKKKK